MSDLTPETLRIVALLFRWPHDEGQTIAGFDNAKDMLEALAAAWEADIQDWHADCLRLAAAWEADCERLEAAEKFIARAFVAYPNLDLDVDRVAALEEEEKP